MANELRWAWHPTTGLHAWPAEEAYHKDWAKEQGFANEGMFAGGLIWPDENRSRDYHSTSNELASGAQQAIEAAYPGIAHKIEPVEQMQQMYNYPPAPSPLDKFRNPQSQPSRPWYKPFGKTAAGGHTFYGNVIGINKKGSGPALRPDIQTREQGQAIMGAGPYVVVADRVLEDHDWCLHHPNIQGIVAEFGGATSHGAVVAREEAIACVVNAKGASQVQPGDQVEVDGQSGQVDVNGGGSAALPEGEGDAAKNFVWNNQSWMIADAKVQDHNAMVSYMTDFGLWNAYGTMGTVYDNGYAQVDKLPPDAEPFERFLRTQYPTLQNIGTQPPQRGKFTPPADHPSLQQGQGPGQMAQTDLYRFIWAQGYFDSLPVDPSDPNKAGTTHEAMIEKYNTQAGDEYAWFTLGFQNEAVAGIIYDSGNVEIYTQEGPPPDQAALEATVKAKYPIAKKFEYVSGGLPGVAASTKTALFDNFKNVKLLTQKGDYSTWEDSARQMGLEHAMGTPMGDHLREVEDVIQAARSGDHNAALSAANVLVNNGFSKNPWAGWNAEDVVQAILAGQGPEAKTAFYGIPNQNFFNWLSGIGVVAAYGADYVHTLISRLKSGEPPAEVVEDLPPHVQQQILDAIHSPVTNMTPYDQEHTAADGEALKCPECGSHTLRGEDLEHADQAEIHCLSCGNTFKHNDIAKERGGITASTLSKGQRVQLTHPEYKGVRGTILDDGKRHEDLNEDQYDILLDNGEEISDIPESAFKKIKSAATQDPHFFMFEELEDDGLIPKEARAKPLPEDVLTGIDEPWLGNGYEGFPVMCYMCGNQRSASLGTRCETCGYVLSVRRDGPPKNAAPNWRVSTVILADGTPTQMQVGSVVNGTQQTTHMYPSGQTSTVCGLPVTTLQPTSNSPGLTNVPCPTCFGNKIARIKLADTNGHDLTVGEWYTMHSDKYPVPDVIMVKEISDDKTITANIEGDDKGLFPITITPDEWHTNKYRFERYTPHKEAALDDTECALCHHAKFAHESERDACNEPGCSCDRFSEPKDNKTARKNYSPTQQNEFVNENLTGRARNIDKINLDNTHYSPDALEEGKTSYFTISENDPLGKHFLW